MATIVTRSGKGSPLSIAEGDANFTNLNNDKVELDDISVTTASAAETSALSYNNTTGVLTFTPVSTTDLIGLTDLGVITAAASGGGALAYNNATGAFTYTPPDLSVVGGIDQVVDDTTPQLGGNLDVQTFSITTSTANGSIQLSPNGTGKVSLSAQTEVNGNLVIQGTNVIISETDNDLQLQALGTGDVKLTGTEVVFNQPVVNFPNGVAQITASNSVDILSDELIVGASSSSTEALITTATGSNCDLKLRGNGTGTILLDDPVALVGGALDVGTQNITTNTVNGTIAIQNNGTGVTSINGGSGLSIATGYLNTGTNTDLVLNPNGTGAVFVNAPNAGMALADTGSSGYGSITGAAGVGIGISADEGAQAATDSKILVTSGGGLTLQAGSGSAATLTGSTVGITGDTTITGDFVVTGATDLDLLTNYVHDLQTNTPTGTYTPDATNGNVIYVVPQGNLTINDFASASIDIGQSITIFFDQSSYSTSFTLTMGSKFLFPGGTAPTLTATGNDLLTMTCLDDGTSTGDNLYIANFVANYQ